MEQSGQYVPRARIGIIGGSGTYRLPGAVAQASVTIPTPYGPPSGPITLARVEGRAIAFLPRHGAGHSVPPQKINYRANLWALKSLGIEAVISSSAVGGLRRGYGPEMFVVPDQLIDRTWGRTDTFFDGTLAEGAEPAGVQHLPAAEPFCPGLRARLADALSERQTPHVPAGTVVVVNGPRFSTRAESTWYTAAGADIISMTQYPEPVLAAELNMGYATLAYITDSDTGHDGSVPVTAEAVFARLKKAQPDILAVLEATVAAIGDDYVPTRTMDPTAVNRIMALPVHGVAERPR
ncbi:MTAP family purine nucleoside phosphorylase [Arthrobacter sp. ISL-28]|uniref:MTAP family purine nucleoside phosphorylase n=1 Tax=Arthrobacter sp. ISL-28 TaxID=2819108 RepID=UPI001BEA4955|nr:MTAP family purine nucleoside phosphorylase [Arthrobacter sp. ISL-28]MBT2519880.1 MTAP family purine nucleoside phosphorylase [Arthrobacter sp. ISL-28]